MTATISEPLERAQTTRLVSFGPQVSFFIYIRVFSFKLMITGTIYVIQARTTITGPNNAYHVVWALGEYFIKIYLCFTKILILFNRLFNKFQDEGTQTTHPRSLGPGTITLPPHFHLPHPSGRVTIQPTTYTQATTTPKTPTGSERRFLPSFRPNKYFFQNLYLQTDIFTDIDIFINIDILYSLKCN